MSGFGKIPGISSILRPNPTTASSDPPGQVSEEMDSEAYGSVDVPPIPLSDQSSPFIIGGDTPGSAQSAADLMPTTYSEPPAFLLPEDQLTVEITPRQRDSDIKEYVYKPAPLYISTSHDVYSRNFCTVNVGKDLPSSVGLVRYGGDGDINVGIADVRCNSSADVPESMSMHASTLGDLSDTSGTMSSKNILQPYCPSLTHWYSTFRSVPDDSVQLLSGRVSTDTNLLLKFVRLQMRQKAFEPLFGSATLYSIIDDEIHRISESFHFDAATENLRRYYGTCYVDSDGQEIMSTATKVIDFGGRCINVADASGERSHMHMCHATVPEELRYKDLFLVVQLSKFMSCDSERAAAPYFARGMSPDPPKHKESCERLCKYRQPVGLGMLRLCDETGKLVGGTSHGELLIPFYSQKVCLSDQQIQLVLRELYPVDGSAPYLRSMDPLDMEMRVVVHDLGKDEQMLDTLLSYEKGYAKLIEAAGNEPHAVRKYSPIVVPAQIQSETAQLVYSNYKSSLQRYSKPHAALSLRQLMPLLPTISSKSSMDFNQITRQAKFGVDNTLFVYPTFLDRFKHRNLSVKVQLIEFQKDVTPSQLFSSPHEVLCCVYNTSYITGPLFLSEAFSRVSYHTKSPAVNDEFKLRLPDVLRSHHWLKFTVMHLHVKPTAQRSSLLGKMMSSNVDVMDKTSTEVGVGFLQLMPHADAILEDKEHNVRVYSFDEVQSDGVSTGKMGSSMANLTEGLIKVRTKAVVSLVSHDRRVQALLKNQPMPLGIFPSSIMSGEVAARILRAAREHPADESKVVQATRDLTYASPVALSRHFVVIMTQLLRTLVAGVGTFSELYSNPFKHDPLRCQAFLTLLHVISQVAKDGPPHSTHISAEKQFLHAFVDYILDEEQPLELADLVRAGMLSQEDAKSIETALAESTSAAAVSAAAAAVTSTSPAKVTPRPQTVAATSLTRPSSQASVFTAASGGAGSDASTVPAGVTSGTGTTPAPGAAPDPATASGAATTAATSATAARPSSMSIKNRMKAIGVEVMFADPPVQEVGSDGPSTGSSNGLSTATESSGGGADENNNNDGGGGGTDEISRDPSNLNIDNIDLLLELNMRNSEDEAPGMSAEDLYMSDSDHLSRGRLSSTGLTDETMGQYVHFSSPSTNGPLTEAHSTDLNDFPGMSSDDYVENPDRRRRGSDSSSESDQDEELTPFRAANGSNSPAPSKGDYSMESSPEEEPVPRSADGSPVDPSDCAPQKGSAKDILEADDDTDDSPVKLERFSERERGGSLASKLGDDARASGDEPADSQDGQGHGPVRVRKDSSPLILPTPDRTNVPQLLTEPAEETLDSVYRAQSAKVDPNEAAHRSAERRSWGKFITDSMWTSAKLDAVGIAGLNTAPNNELSASISAKYLDDIANHVVLQTEKLILEELFGRSIKTITSDIPRGQSEYTRAFSVKAQGFDDSNQLPLPTDDQILAGNRFRLSRKDGQHMPFRADRAWFAAVDAGRPVDDNDVAIPRDPDEDSNTAAEFLLRQKQQDALAELEICIEPILPVFDPIEGYKARSKKIKGEAAALTAPYQHWWPWLYEVLVFQWGAIMTISLSNIKLISNNRTESMVGAYPFESDIREQSVRGPVKADSVRARLAEHCPMLLRIIYKSLAMRICREGLRAPVVLDVQFMGAIENLVMLLAVESASFSSGLWRSRKLVSSLATFLRSLFALVSPNQVIRLIRSYFRASRRNNRVEEAELRLQMVEELGWFDHFVAVNFPYTIDAPLSSFAFECTMPPSSVVACSYETAAYTAVGIRGITNPAPYALVHILVSEIILSYSQEEKKVKDAALEVMRELLVRHAYDARYQSKVAQQRVACMYLPLLQELLKHQTRIACQRHDSSERKDVLAIFMYLVQGMPDRVLRQFVRSLCIEAMEPSVGFESHPPSYTPSLRTPFSILSLKSDRSRATPVTKSYIPPRVQQDVPVFQLILMLHSILDTFECPRIPSDKPFSSVSTSGTGSQVAPVAYAQVLAPGVVVEGGPESHATSTRRASADTAAPAAMAKSSSAALMYKSLDQRLQSKKTAASIAAKRGIGGPKGGEERSWVEHARKMDTPHDTRDGKVVVKMPINRQIQRDAAMELCEIASSTVVAVLLVLFEVCPPELSNRSSADPGGVAKDYAFILRDSNIDESVLVGIANLRVVYFMREALSVILHGLYCNQTDELVCLLFDAASTAIRNFGAKVFLVAVEDSLQDWMRASLFHCGSHSKSVTHTASNFILYLLRACYHYLGSTTLVANTILAVINDVIETILDNYQHQIKFYSDEDEVLKDLDNAIASMKRVAQWNLTAGGGDGDGTWGQPNLGAANNSAFCKSVIQLMDNLEVIMLANSDLRRNVSHPVGYDFYGSNMLDGPWNERNSALMSAIRNKRRNVLPDPVVGKLTPISGFHLEEVMQHLVAAAEVYDPFKLPRLRMYWLENLAMLHKRNMNRAEGAEVRWKIFKLCELVEDTWRHQWVPRPALAWTRRSGGVTKSPDSHSPSLGVQALIAAANAGMATPGNTKTAHLSIGRHHDSASPEGDFTEKDRNFYAVLKAALEAKPNRAWQDAEQYLTHMQVSLDEATKGYNSVNLTHLAERTSLRLVHLYRMLRKPERMLGEYTRMADAVKNITEKGITTSMAMGTYYRVCYDGLGVPPHLRGKEFIFRNGNHMHVKEFQDAVVGHLRSIVDDGVSVVIAQNISNDHTLTDPLIAVIIMNSVKLLKSASEMSLRSMDSASMHNKRPPSFPPADRTNVEAANQVKAFHYSVPFTLHGKSHAKSIDEQWMRSTILTVKDPFPYILTRQLVQSREVRIYSPIEVAIYDIEERIEAMESELEKVVRNTSDCNNLMRIVQGTVMPQVNLGVGEVAKVFLSQAKSGGGGSSLPGSKKELSGSNLMLAGGFKPVAEEAMSPMSTATSGAATCGSTVADRGDMSAKLEPSDSERMVDLQQEKLVLKLKVTLIEFLTCSKLLLQKARSALIDGQRSASSDTGAPASTMTTSLSTNSLVTPAAANRSSLSSANTTGSGGSANRSSLSGSAAAAVMGNPNNANVEIMDREREQYHNWQREMESAFRSLLRTMKPYFADWHDSDVLHALQRDMNDC